MTTDEIAESNHQQCMLWIDGSDKDCHSDIILRQMKQLAKEVQSIHPDSKLVAEIQRRLHEQKKTIHTLDLMTSYQFGARIQLLEELLQFSQEGTGK